MGYPVSSPHVREDTERESLWSITNLAGQKKGWSTEVSYVVRSGLLIRACIVVHRGGRPWGRREWGRGAIARILGAQVSTTGWNNVEVQYLLPSDWGYTPLEVPAGWE